MNQVKRFIQSYLKNIEAETTDFFITSEFENLFGMEYVENAKCLKTTNIDLIFSNLILQADGKIYCIDNEWVFNFPIPLEYVMWRAASQLYSKYISYLREEISRNNFLTEIGLDENNFDIYAKMEHNFSENILGKNYMLNYRQAVMTIDCKMLS